MPENEIAIPYTEVLRLVRLTANNSRLKQLQNDIDADKTGTLYLYAKGSNKFEIKRYKTGRFIKKVWS